MYHTLEFNMVKNVRSHSATFRPQSFPTIFYIWRLAQIQASGSGMFRLQSTYSIFSKTFPAYTFFCEKLNVVTVLDGMRHDTKIAFN